MCRKSKTKTCNQFGEPHTWSRMAPLPPPEWLFTDVLGLGQAAHLAASGKYQAAADVLGSLREGDAREWFVEHAQISSHHRRARLRVERPHTLGAQRKDTPMHMRHAVWQRDNWHCRYCGLPTIPPKNIEAMRVLLGEEVLPWGSTNASKHGTLYVARAGYDHVVPVSLGGGDTVANLVTCCSGCNYGKDRWSVEELGLDDPRLREPKQTEWDGISWLTLPVARRCSARK